MMNLKEAHDLIPLYALGLLEDEETRLLEQLLATDIGLRDELRDYETIGDALALTSLALPAPDLRAKLSQRIQQQSTPIPVPQKRILKLSRWMVLGSVAAVLVFIFGLVVFLQNDDSPPADATRIAMTEIERILTDPNALAFEVNAQENYESIHGTLTVTGDESRAVLKLEGINNLPPEQDYQLWLVRNTDDRYDAGVFDATNERSAVYLVELPSDFATYQAAGVTIEPAGGSPGPTGDIVLLTLLSSQE